MRLQLLNTWNGVLSVNSPPCLVLDQHWDLMLLECTSVKMKRELIR